MSTTTIGSHLQNIRLRAISAEQAASEFTEETLQQEFPGIEPNHDEDMRGRLYAYELAAERQRREEAGLRKQMQIAEAKRMYTYDECWNITIDRLKLLATQMNFKLVMDEDYKRVLHLLCLYFTNDAAFEKQTDISGRNYSLNKGIFLQSAMRGTGKTLLMCAFTGNKRGSYIYQHVERLRMLYQQYGPYEADKFTTYVKVYPECRNYYQQSLGVLYDEMFSEDVVNHMGTPIYISEYIIKRLYDIQKGIDFSRFHITSNYDGAAVEKKFGVNLRSRLSEMFNLIKLEGEDKRRGK